MGYYIGDIPVAALVITPALETDLSEFTAATATLRKPDGTNAGTMTAEISDDDSETIALTFPSDVVLDVAGVWTANVTLTGAGSTSQRIEPVWVVVDDPDSGWHTLATARAKWSDAPEDDDDLYELLSVAQADVLAYGQALPVVDGVTAPAPLNYRRAQLMHARDVWNAARVDPSGALGSDSFVIKPFPLDWMVKQVIRPAKAIGSVGGGW